MMTVSQQKALVSLLQEGDETTVGLVKGKLIEGGHAHLPEYQLMKLASGPARDSLREVIYHIEASKTLGDISRGLAKLRTWSQVEELCWDLAQADHPGFDGGPYSRRLDQWAAEIRLISPTATPKEKVDCLARYLGHDQKISGNSHDYYHPRNGYLPWVIEFSLRIADHGNAHLYAGRHAARIARGGHRRAGTFPGPVGRRHLRPLLRRTEFVRRRMGIDGFRVTERQRAVLSKGCTPVQTVIGS